MQTETKTDTENVRHLLEGNGIWKLVSSIDESKNNAATQEILKILPYDSIQTALRVYRHISFEKTSRYSYLLKKNMFPKRDIDAIKEILKKHVLKRGARPGGEHGLISGWIEEQDVKDIMKYIAQKFNRRPKGVKALRSKYTEDWIKEKKKTRPIEPLTALVFILARQLKPIKNKIPWRLIEDFLTEQKIINIADVKHTDKTLKDLYQKTKENSIKQTYEFYRQLDIYPVKILSHIDPSDNLSKNMLEQSKIYRDMYLPDWDTIIPS